MRRVFYVYIEGTKRRERGEDKIGWGLFTILPYFGKLMFWDLDQIFVVFFFYIFALIFLEDGFGSD